jgi:hypothetical protein
MKKRKVFTALFSLAVLFGAISTPIATAGQAKVPKFKTLKDAAEYRQGLSEGAQAAFEAMMNGKVSGSAKSMQGFCKSSIRFKFNWSSMHKQGFLAGCNSGN